MVIESPLQHKDAPQGEVEAESLGPVLVRGSSSATLLPFPTALVLCACSVPLALCGIVKLALPVSCELSSPSFPVDCFRLHFDFLCEERCVDILWVIVASRRLLCIEQPCIVQNYVPLSCRAAKGTPREALFNSFCRVEKDVLCKIKTFLHNIRTLL